MGCPFDPGDAGAGVRTPPAQRGVSPTAFARTALAIGGSRSLERLREQRRDVPEVSVDASLGAIVRGRPTAQHAWPPRSAVSGDALTHHLLVGCQYEGSDPAGDRERFETALRAVEGAAAGVEDVLGVAVGYTARYLDRYAGGTSDLVAASSPNRAVDCWLHLASDAAWLVLTAELALLDENSSGDSVTSDVGCPLSVVERRAIHAPPHGSRAPAGERAPREATDGGTDRAADDRTDDGTDDGRAEPIAIPAGDWAGGAVGTVARSDPPLATDRSLDTRDGYSRSPLAHLGVETATDASDRPHAVAYGRTIEAARARLPEDPDWTTVDVIVPPRERRALPAGDDS